MSKEMWIDALDDLLAEYADAHGIDISEIPPAVHDRLCDRASGRVTDQLADIADREKDRLKELGQWPPRSANK